MLQLNAKTEPENMKGQVMKIGKSAFLILIMTSLTTGFSHAVTLPSFFSDNMVLQRDQTVPIWGKASPGEKIAVTFADQNKETVADANGEWLVQLDPMAATNDAGKLGISGIKPVILKNVVIGDVWLCSGQSNMEWTVSRSADFEKERDAADYPAIRLVKLPHVNQPFPQDDVRGSWTVCSSGTVANFSATAYFFARRLHRELDVPIGLISCNWGGTRIEPWTAPEGFAQVPELKNIYDQIKRWNPSYPEGREALNGYLQNLENWLPKARIAIADGEYPTLQPQLPIPESHQQPTKIYNGMIHPLLPYALSGVIWYQGESNGGESTSYFYKTQALIKGWRQLWDKENLPFYYVQLANYRHSDPKNPAGGDGWARLREAQLDSLQITNTGMAVIIDIGEANNIHPKNKQDVGERLALWPLAQLYGKDVVFSGPLYRQHKVEENKIRIYFDHIGSGLMIGQKTGLAPTQELTSGKLKWFAVADAEQKWHWADAVIDGDTVVVSSLEVPEPVAVRYAFAMNPEGANLYNKEGLPASPFRTDKW